MINFDDNLFREKCQKKLIDFAKTLKFPIQHAIEPFTEKISEIAAETAYEIIVASNPSIHHYTSIIVHNPEELSKIMEDKWPNHRVINIQRHENSYEAFIEIDRSNWPIPC